MQASEQGFIAAPIGFGLGIAAYFALPAEPSLASVFLACGLSAAVWLGVARWPSGRALRWYPLLHWTSGLAALAAAGLAAAAWEAHRVYTPQLLRNISDTRIAARLVWTEPHPSGAVFLIAPRAVDGWRGALPVRIRLHGARDSMAGLRPGCELVLRASLVPLTKSAAPRGFDFRFFYYYQRIGASGFLRALEAADCTQPVRGRERLAWLRQSLGERIAAVLPQPAGGLAVALLTGARGRLQPQAKEAFRDSGLAHMLAISGLHMVLVAGSFYVLLRMGLALWPRLAQRVDIRKPCALLALGMAVIYLMLSGASVATQRAFLMIALIFLAVLFARRALTMRNVALAALLVLALSPHTLLLASFQMSFAAVVALVAFYDWMGRGWIVRWPERRLGLWERVLRRVWIYAVGLTLTSLIAGAATGFLAAWHFQRVALFGLLANLLAMPLLGIWIMPNGLAALFAMPFGLEAAPLRAMGWGIDWVLAVAQWVTSLPHAVQHLRPSAPHVLALAAAGFLWLCLWPRRGRWLGAPVLALAILLLGRAPLSDGYVLGGAWQIALRQPDGRLAISERRGRQYEARNWLAREQDSRPLADAVLPCASDAASDAGLASEGASLCRLRGKAKSLRIGWAKTRAGLVRACRHRDGLGEGLGEGMYDLLITHLRAPRACAAHHVLDGRLLRRYQVVAMRFVPNGTGWQVRHQLAHRRHRLWTGDVVLR